MPAICINENNMTEIFSWLTNKIDKTKDVLLNRIEHEYIYCDAILVINDRF